MSPAHAFIPTVGASTRDATTTASLSSVGRTTISALKSSPVHHALTSPSMKAVSCPKVKPHAPPSKDTDGRQDKPHGRGARPSRIIVLFGDDLRVYDNAALSKAAIDAAAVSTGVLIPVMLSGHGLPTTSTYVAELAGQLQALGSSLVHVGDMEKLSELIRRVDIEAIYMNHSTTKQDAHLQQQQQKQQKRKATSRTTVKQIFADIVAQALNVTVEGSKTPQSLPALPAMTGMAFETVKASNSADSLNDALKTLSAMDKKRETLVVDKTPDVAVSLKQVLDHGVVSPRTVVKHVHRVMNGLKGRTFSEMVWRTYVCLSACRAAGVRSARTNAVAA